MNERIARAIAKNKRCVGLQDDSMPCLDNNGCACWQDAQAAIAAMWTPFDPKDESTWPTAATLCAVRLTEPKEGELKYDLLIFTSVFGPKDLPPNFFDAAGRQRNVTRYLEITEP